eukprot:c15844_g1_i2 orf=172-684(+)
MEVDPSSDMSSQNEIEELERETGERRRGRDVIVAVDLTANSKRAFDWAITHLCRLADTLHLVHVLPKSSGDLLCGSPKGADQELQESTLEFMENLVAEAYEVAMVKTEVNIVSGDIGKMIIEEALKIIPVAVVMGTHGHGMLKSVLQGSVSEYVSHHCPYPVVLVPRKDF